MYPPVVAITRPPARLSDEAIFSRAGSRVMAVVQTTWPSATASFWMWPSGEAAYTAVRSGSATGVAVVIWYDPAQREHPAGAERHSTVPLSASIASVLP